MCISTDLGELNVHTSIALGIGAVDIHTLTKFFGLCRHSRG